MTFDAWLRDNCLKLPVGGPNYMRLEQLWFSGKPESFVNQDQAIETLKSMEEFKNRIKSSKSLDKNTIQQEIDGFITIEFVNCVLEEINELANVHKEREAASWLEVELYRKYITNHADKGCSVAKQILKAKYIDDVRWFS